MIDCVTRAVEVGRVPTVFGPPAEAGGQDTGLQERQLVGPHASWSVKSLHLERAAALQPVRYSEVNRRGENGQGAQVAPMSLKGQCVNLGQRTLGVGDAVEPDGQAHGAVGPTPHSRNLALPISADVLAYPGPRTPKALLVGAEGYEHMGAAGRRGGEDPR